LTYCPCFFRFPTAFELVGGVNLYDEGVAFIMEIFPMKSSICSQFTIAILFLACIVAPLEAATVSINLSTEYQKISGFGASSAWNSLNAVEEKLLWDTTAGAGFSLHRLRIDETALVTSSSNKEQLAIAKAAVAMGVTVWASPWAPVSSWQTNYGTDASGNAKLKFNFNYATQWATLLANYAKDMKAAGVPLYAISAQNEPDGTNFNNFSASELVTWIKSYLGPALEGTGVKIIAPETVNWYSFPSYKTAILGDATASAYIPIIATHEYGGSPAAYPEIAAAGKEFWQTEIYESLDVTDPGINSALNTAKLMHEAIVTAGVNAWHYWWIHGPTGTSLFPWSSSTPAKRLWAMGNYSRFVRPGFLRIGATAAPASGVTLSAYRDSSSTKLIVVAINTNSSAVSLDFTINGATPVSMTPYVTDTTQDLSAQTSQTLSTNTPSYSLPKRSITSLVFQLVEPTQDPYVSMTIPGKVEVENYDLGGAGVAYYDADATNSGGAYRTDGVDITGDATEGYKVGWTVAGEWLEYTISVDSTSVYNWEARVSMGGDSAAFHMSLDGTNITGTVKVPNTGDDWDTYITISGTTTAELSAGTHVLRITIDRSYANIDWISFAKYDPVNIPMLGVMLTKPTTYQVFDLQGKKLGVVQAKDTYGLRATILKQFHRSGVYVVKQVSEKGIVARKFVINAQ
jgi:glucuronoarabinoxylan endo-1,4-beta-xylanase